MMRSGKREAKDKAARGGGDADRFPLHRGHIHPVQWRLRSVSTPGLLIVIVDLFPLLRSWTVCIQRERAMSFQVNGELVPAGGGDNIPLIRELLTIGRRESCDICMRFPNISGLHAEMSFRNGY